MSTPFTHGGQRGWQHDLGHRYGGFHTFDALDVGGQRRKVHLLLPRAPGPRPLLVLHDGDAVFWPGGAFGKSWRLPERLDALAGRIDPPIVVAVEPRDRAYEYTHVDWAAGTRPWGGLAGYTAWLADALVPWVRAHYPVRPGRAAIAGSSHGGLASFYAATARPDTFGQAAAMSPSVWVEVDGWEAQQAPLPLEQGALLSMATPVLADPARRPSLWLCWGLRRDGGFHNHRTEALATARGRELAALCERLGYRRQDLAEGELPRRDADLWVYEDPAGSHDELSWSRRISGVLQAFFG